MDLKASPAITHPGKSPTAQPKSRGNFTKTFQKNKNKKKCIKASRERGSFRSLPIDGAQACKLIPVPPNFLNQIDILVGKEQFNNIAPIPSALSIVKKKIVLLQNSFNVRSFYFLYLGGSVYGKYC